MVNVECKQCPIRNFCPILKSVEVERVDGEIVFHDCPIYIIADHRIWNFLGGEDDSK